MAEMEVAHDIESSISRAMIARVSDFKQKADTLTLEGVRRVLEQDLGLDKFTLDAHKKFIKQALQECFYATNDENSHGNLGEMHQEVLDSKQEGTATLVQPQKKSKLSSVGNGEKLKEGLSSTKMNASKHVPEQSSGKYDSANFEEIIKKAIRKRASHFCANSEKITLSGVRRLLEEDLELNKNELDAHKKFISDELDKVLQLPQVEPKPSNKKKKLTKGSPEIHQKYNSRSPKEDSTSASSESDVSHSEEDQVKPKRKTSNYGKMKSDEGLKKRKWTADVKKTSTKEKKKKTKLMIEKISDSENSENSDGQSPSSSSEEIPKKKNLTSTQMYGKQVEHLKSIIKSSGMSVPPSVYKRAKQAPENRRESALIKELEEILEREGLSTNSSEKEIKTVRRKKERARELEGIDMSNIVSSSRRRSTSSYIAVKPQVPIVSEEEDEEEQEETDDDNISAEASEESDEDGDNESE